MRQFFAATQNALAGYNNNVDNDGFAPYAFYYIGDFLLLFYLVITAIVCINMLIAMMGNRFNFLVEKQILKRQVAFAKGDIYFQTEKFLLPPPFNILHLLILGLSYPWWENRKFQRWLPKNHNDAYSICMNLKEMYLEFRKAEIESGETNTPDDADDDDKKLAKINVRLHPFVSVFFRKRRPKEKEFLQHYIAIAETRSKKLQKKAKAIELSDDLKKDSTSVKLEVIEEGEGMDQAPVEGDSQESGDEADDNAEVDDSYDQ